MAPHADRDIDPDAIDEENNVEEPVDSEGTESSSEEEGEDEEEDFDVKKKFDKILRDLKSGHLDLSDPQQRAVFLSRNAEVLSAKTNDDSQNLLHILANSEKETLPPHDKLEPLIKLLVQLPENNLLAERDGDNKTPLYIAAQRAKKKFKLIKSMIETHDDIDSVLAIPCFNLETCLHVVIRKMAPQAYVLYLINLAGPKTLRVQDNKGNTALHVAIDYALCVEDHIKIVKALIDKSDEAMDLVNSKGMSPYRFHEETCMEAINKARKAQDAESRKGIRDPDQRSNQGRPMIDTGTQERREPYGPPERATPAVAAPPPFRPIQRTNTLADAAPGKYGAGSARGMPTSSAPQPGRPSVSVDTNKTDGSTAGSVAPVPAVESRKSAKGASKKSTKTKVRTREEVKPSPESANAVKSLLKLHYLRTRKHDEAVDFLYGSAQENQIYFDLYGCGPVISQNWIKNGVDYLRFENVLQYVAVPQVRVEAPSAPQRRGASKRTVKSDGKGRSDLVFLFKWLKGERNVETILKVIVDDLQEPAHSDEAIESALEGVGVEVWDWRKTDLCSEVIFKVAPMARIVHLYWSGNNSALRGWSEEEGLAKLEKLERVYLNVQQGLESSERTEQNVKAFIDRMKKRCPKVEVSTSSSRAGSVEGSSAQADALRAEQEVRHRWLITMDEFADFLTNMERNVEPPLVLEEPITVALIDDGIDIDDIGLQRKIVGGRSFCHRDMEQNLSQPYYVSSGGHGTAMASLICRVCPNVRLYVLKLNEYGIEPGKRQITAESAAKAVTAAIDKGVHIINMSWTIERTENNTKGISDLEKAIERAAKEGILMFCAATDQGALKDRSYPAASSTKKIFKIGAAEASGTALKWLGDQRAVDFIFPGHNVVKERPGDVPVDKYTSLTGSSVATALASGLAAVILYCVQVGAQPARARARGVTMDDFRMLKKHDRMRDAFLEIGTTDESEKKYIAVWERFKEAVKKARSGPPDKWIDIVTDLAALLKKRQL
ncbi:hypothetical protein F5884DRAFT_801362 [Xylogone sp. PMI_703]|nr:hypothetical protein F5884DRAFT_801362 [Xylogone sp. PMI_703]